MTRKKVDARRMNAPKRGITRVDEAWEKFSETPRNGPVGTIHDRVHDAFNAGWAAREEYEHRLVERNNNSRSTGEQHETT